MEKKIVGILVMTLLIATAVLPVVGNVNLEKLTWSIETVDSTGYVGGHTSIALDTNDYPHISYCDFTNGDLKYAYKDIGGWTIETVDNSAFVGEYTSIALDTNDYPHISYYDWWNGDLKYAYKDVGGWTNETVDSTGNVGAHTSIALDTNDYPHISYHDETNGDLKYAYKDAGGWTKVAVDSADDVGEYTSIALDTNDYPHISYHDETNGDLKYAYGGAEENVPPDAPTIDGETNGKAGTEYDYDFNATDPDGDDVKYYIDWGDGDTEWTDDFSSSGTPVTVSHIWTSQDTYTITAKAQDEHGLDGPEGTLVVSMPMNQQMWFLKFLQNHPRMFPIFRQLLGL